MISNDDLNCVIDDKMARAHKSESNYIIYINQGNQHTYS